MRETPKTKGTKMNETSSKNPIDEAKAEMGNPQERLICDLSWLAGIWEGEGWVSICRNSQTSERQKGQTKFVPNCGLTNTDEMLIMEVIRILTENDIKFCIQKRSPNGLGTQCKYELSLIGYKRCQKLLSLISIYLRGAKKLRTEKVLQFIDSRKMRNQKSPYNEFEIGIFESLYSYQGRSQSKSSTTLRQGLILKFGQDKV